MKYVLITGGTSGIGYEFAKKIAAEGYGIVIAASNEERLNRVMHRLEKFYSVPVHGYVQDLGIIGGAKTLYDRIKKDRLQIDILVNNAGIGMIGATHTSDFQKDEAMMVLNMITPVELCKLFLRDMYQRKEGKILNVCSTGAFQPGPYTSTYYAGKSFLLSYTRAIRQEAKGHGIQICALCPGTTETEFFVRAGKKTPFGAMPAKKVAEYGYRKLMQNKEVAVPGIINKIFRVIPANIKIFFVAIIKK